MKYVSDFWFEDDECSLDVKEVCRRFNFLLNVNPKSVVEESNLRF